MTALDVWGLYQQAPGDLLHLTTPSASGLRSRPGIIVHHRQGFRLDPPHVRIRHDLPVTRLEAALVDSWPLLPLADRHGPVIRAVNERLTTPDRLRAALTPLPRLPGRAPLRTLLTRLADGCRSPLEIWGHEHVFVGPGMPKLHRQFRLRIGQRSVYLDLYAEHERVDIELDGAATHGNQRQREIDLRRDALLATAGILTVRFSHRRLVHEPDKVRRVTLAVLASRR
ncbi:DUF559 domain-containing protein [Micromonospora sp. WMMD558]|uniref:DUF559 domain-containing protein n=1 Tax=Micromonospora sp. WMMD558 TaxID=3403462 RepID=UPI003BF502CF